ncbi:MAG: TIR domain-containing protein [Ilumatobacteraceae bacterium]
MSYRRSISAGYAGRLYDSLKSRLPRDSTIFMDVASLGGGVEFEKEISETVPRCDAFLVLLAPGWASVSRERGTPRLADPDDLVRRELEAAFEHGVLIVPVLLNGAAMPGVDELPPSISDLHRRNAIDLSDTHWHSDVDRLLEVIESPRHSERQRSRILAAVVIAVVVIGALAVGWLLFGGGSSAPDASGSPTAKLLFSDSLHDSTRDWPEGTDECTQHRAGSGYQINAAADNQYLYCIADTTFDPSLAKLEDVRVEASARSLSDGGSGPYGPGGPDLRCHTQRSAGTGDSYSTTITPSGYWSLVRFNSGKETALRDGLDPTVAPTKETPLKLALSCINTEAGVELEFWSAGEKLFHYVDGSQDALRAGAVGMGGTTYTTASYGVEFTDFRVLGPRDAPTAAPSPTTTRPRATGPDFTIP